MDEALGLFEDHVLLVDNKVKKIKDKQDNKLYRGEISHEYQEKIDLIDLEIKRLLKESENLGENGEMDEMERKMEEVEKLREDKDAIFSIAENPMLAQKQMKLCEVCGAMQSINDMEKRNLSHLDGKLHIGFAKMRKQIEKMKKRYESVLLEIEVDKVTSRKRVGKDRHRRKSDYRSQNYESKGKRIKKDDHKKMKKKKKSKKHRSRRSDSRD